MGPKITSLTDEQTARLDSYADEWIARAHSTTPCERAAVGDAMRRAYELAGLGWSGRVYWAASPLHVAVMGPAIAAYQDAGASDPVGAAAALAEHLAGREPLPGEWSAHKREAVEAVRGGWWQRCGGAMWASWQAWRSCFLDVVQIEIDPQLEARWRAYVEASAAGWWYPHSDYVVVCDLPTALHVEQVGPRGWGSHRMHCETGPAISWEGWALYYWHGTRVPERWIMDRASVTAEEVLGHENIETRRAGAEIIGWDVLLQSLSPTVIDEDPDPEIGTLLHVDLPDAPRTAILRVRCGTGRTFALPVPPDLRTARAANAWTYGIEPEELEPEVRT